MPLELLPKEERAANRAKSKEEERFGKLLLRLNSTQEAVRLAALKELREEWPDGMHRLLSSYQSTTNRWKRRGKWCLFSLVWMFAGFVLDAFLSRRGIHITPLIQATVWPFTLFVIFCFNAPKQRNSSVRLLLNFDDVNIVGPLIDALAFRDEITQQEARKALTQLLPRLRASDANLLNAEQREQLRNMLFKDHTELVVSILKAYEHVGDAPELADVERLMETPLWHVEVREAAEACLPFLRLRAQQAQSSQSLLRASEPVTTADALLRPAASGKNEDEAQLLRMSASEH